jgi:transposase
MGISKRGNQHLRSLLVHGARAVVRTAPRKTDLNNQWVNQLRERRGFTVPRWQSPTRTHVLHRDRSRQRL